MPDKCCVPACRGNYTNKTKISVFRFPRNDDGKRKWLRAICRENFTPSEHSVVCEAHFKPEDVERITSMYDSKTGHLLTAPLAKPRLREGSGDVTNAHDRLKGALHELLEQSDDSSVPSHDETSQSDVFGQLSAKKPVPMNTEPVVVPPQQNIRNMRPQRKRRRREELTDAAFHHTYVMKLFDRSVDLAQFKEDTPLYPICRAWMANQPRNSNLIPKMRTPTPTPPDDASTGAEGGDSDGEVVRDTYKMPPPLPIPGEDQKTLRVPSPIPQPKDDNSHEEPKPSRENLLHNHLVHWTAVRKKWHTASHKNEARFNKSGQILKAIYRKAQKAFE